MRVQTVVVVVVVSGATVVRGLAVPPARPCRLIAKAKRTTKEKGEFGGV